MPFLLFRITRKNWVRIYSSDSESVVESGLQADALRDLKTVFNELEAWLIDDAKSQLNRIIIELDRDTLLPPDNVLVDLHTIESIGLNPKVSDIRDSSRVLIERFSAKKLIDLTETIYSAIENL